MKIYIINSSIWLKKSNENLFNEVLDIINNETNKQSTKYLLKYIKNNN